MECTIQRRILRERVNSGEVSNECWSSEIGGAKRRSHMGPLPSVVPISRIF